MVLYFLKIQKDISELGYIISKTKYKYVEYSFIFCVVVIVIFV